MTKHKKEPVGYVYKITSPEGREYVGLKKSATFVESYWSSSQNKDFWNDIEKFGKDAFKRTILCWCYSLEELNERETYWITHSNALVDKGGYNICMSFPQMVWTDEMRKARSVTSKEYYSHEENRRRIGEILKNSPKHQASRKTVGPKISKALKAKMQDPEFKAKKYAFTQDPAFKAKVAKVSKNKHWYNNGTDNVSAYECPEGFVPGMLKLGSIGKKLSAEHRQALSKAKKGRVWYTDGVNSVLSFECPEGYHPGRPIVVREPTHWWNNGQKNIKAAECPGEGWKLGRMDSFEIDISTENLALLYSNYTIYNIAKRFNATVSQIKCLLRRRGII